MGKRGNKRAGRGGGARSQRQNWQDIPRTSERFETFYNSQGFIPEEDREAFWEALRRDLPNSFRFTGSRGHALAVQEKLKDFYVPQITSIQYEGNNVEPPRPVPWYPDQLAWSMTTSKQVIRRFPPFASFQKFLVAETDIGNISRQEVVSMIPPLLMDLRPGMTVLDMCAAPGSKSAQLMEMIHAGEEDAMLQVSQQVKDGTAGPEPLGPEGLADDGRTTGLLIANDADNRRAHMLIHQMKRLSSPNLIVTNHDATMYPSIRLPPKPAADGKPIQNRYLKFDRILADVPCTGDGTARKNVSVWKDWSPTNAIGLHAIQVRILVRALQMLKVGGRVVYSTCSMNPLENEAVVASAIERCGGLDNVHIVDCSNELPGLKRATGLRSWKVMDRENRMWASWKEIEEQRAEAGINGLGRIAEGMFPPTTDMPLERCMRIYPYLQDTGGFFITVLEKRSEIRAKPEDPTKVIPKGTIAALTEELEFKQKNGTGEPLEKINALDDLVVPDEEAKLEEDKNASVAEVTNLPPYSATYQMSPTKRDAETLEDSELPAKRAKLDDSSEVIVGDRPIHRPPPAVESDVPDTSDVTPAPAADTPQAAASTEPQSQAQSQPPKKRKPGQPIEEPFRYLDPKHPELDPIFEFFDISERFPRDRFMVRNADALPARTVYYTSALARDILVANEGQGMKFVHCGVKMFVKQDAQRIDVCRWRIQTDGLKVVQPWLGPARAVTLTQKETLRKLLVEMFPKVDDGGWQHLGEIGERVRDIPMGCSILYINPEGENQFTERTALPLWRSLHSINLMLRKEDRHAMLLRIFNDDSEVVNTTQKRAGATQETSNGNNEAAEAVATEEEAIKEESIALGQYEQEKADTKPNEEEGRFNTTV